MEANQMKVIIQKWEESERGWGTRPDGYSVHPNEEARQRFIDNYWANMPKEVPDEYSRPHGTPYETDLNTNFASAKHADGYRVWDNKYPGHGGWDGWI